MPVTFWYNGSRFQGAKGRTWTFQEAACNDYNLSPSRYVASDDQEPPLEEMLVLLAQAEEARAEVDAELDRVLSTLGFGG